MAEKNLKNETEIVPYEPNARATKAAGGLLPVLVLHVGIHGRLPLYGLLLSNVCL